jgi:signal transduction histidine kinase
MADDTVERKTLVGFALSLVILLLVSGIAIVSLRGYRETARMVSHTHEVIGELGELSTALAMAEAARRGYLATSEGFYLEERSAARRKILTHLQAVKALTVDNRAQQVRLSDLEAALDERETRVRALVAQVREQGLAAGQLALRSQEIPLATSRATARISEIEAEERGLLKSRQGLDGYWANVLMGTFVALLVSMTSILTWLCLRIRKEMLERTQAMVSLDHLNHSLQSANRELESFSYSVSHDLRSPLRSIDGYAQMLEEDFSEKLDDTGRRCIRTIRGGSQRMAALIDDLLTFSRLSRQSLTRTRVDMTALARRAAAEVLETQPDPKPAVDIPELPSVAGDPALLRQVWTNLISNAVKYSSKAASPHVEVRAACEEGRVRYEVQDNGVGFDMKYADKLFGVFQRLHSMDEYPGTGVGLAIVHRIVSRHAGAVTAQGERGKGATFQFTLPSEV